MKKKIIFILAKAICCFVYFANGNDDFIEHLLNIKINSNNTISVKNIADNQILKGTFYGFVEELSDSKLNNSRIECDLLGRSYKGRGFSCGFAVIEDLQGYCYINTENNGSLITSWQCNTSAGINGDAFCLGKVNIVQGLGEFSGVAGFGKINMPLAKSFIDKKISIPMKLSLKVKYPLSLR